MQRGVLHHHAADRDRRKLRHWRQRASASHLNLDIVEDRRRLLGGEFMRDRPARAARDEAEPVLPVEPVHLVDHAVDVIGQTRALLADLAVIIQQIIDVGAQRHQRIDDEACSVQPLHHAELGIFRHVAHLAPGIGEEFQRPRRGDGDILLAQRAGGRVARVGEHGLARFLLLPVQLEEILTQHIDLAAHFADRRDMTALQSMRHVMDGADILGDILADITVAAGRRRDKRALDITQRQ